MRNEKLVNLRNNANLTQKQLAEKVGCNIVHIQKLEGGQRNITKCSLELAVKIAKALNVNVEKLADFEN